MNRIRVSTTVDGELLTAARQAREGLNDARLLDEALELLVARHRRAEIDASYAIYEAIPLDTPDEWGSLAEWLDAGKESPDDLPWEE